MTSSACPLLSGRWMKIDAFVSSSLASSLLSFKFLPTFISFFPFPLFLLHPSFFHHHNVIPVLPTSYPSLYDNII